MIVATTTESHSPNAVKPRDLLRWIILLAQTGLYVVELHGRISANVAGFGLCANPGNGGGPLRSLLKELSAEKGICRCFSYLRRQDGLDNRS
jgi:hypothetical protein